MARPKLFLTALLVAAAILLSGTAAAQAAVLPVEGPWSATTSVGLPVTFKVSGSTVVDAHFGFNWGFCGEYESSLPNTDPIDEVGHWSFEDTRGSMIEGTFVAPDRVEGKVIAVARMLPGCPRTEASFVAIPGETPLPVPPQVYVVADAHTGHRSREPEFVALGKGLGFYFSIDKWKGLGHPVARATALTTIKRRKREWHPQASLRLSALVEDGPGTVVYSKLHYSLHGPVPKGFPRQGTHTYR